MYRSIAGLIAALLLVASPSLAQQTAASASAVLSPADSPCAVSNAVDIASVEHRLRQMRAETPVSGVLLVQQLSEQLRTKNVDAREQAIMAIIHYATNYGDLVDFSPLSDELLRVFVSDSSPSRRIMIAHAISRIGGPTSNAELMRLASRDSSPQVRRLASYAAASAI